MEAPIQQDSTVVQTETPSVPQMTETPNGSPPQTVTPPEVGGGVPTSQEAEWRQYVIDTNRHLKSVTKELRAIKESFNQRPQTSTPDAPQTRYAVTQDELLKNPLDGIDRIASSKAEQTKQEIAQMIQSWRYEQSLQEGNRLIDTNELIKKDPEGRTKLDEILLETDANGNSLQNYSKINPVHAAQLALAEYRIRHQQPRSAAAPTKAQMTSTATAQTANSSQATTAAQIESLHNQVTAFPDLMKDPAFMAKMDALLKQSDLESKIRK